MSIARLMQMAASGQGGEPDPFFNQTTLLLHGDGTNGAQNNTFLDSSTNNFTITRNGNTTQGTFSPFSLPNGEWSNYFTGAGTCLNVPYSTDFNFANDFSVECFAYVIDAGRSNDSIKVGVLIGAGTSGSTTDNWLISFVISGGVITTITFGYENAAVVQATSLSISINAWHHFLVCRTGTTVSIFVDGTRLATATSSTSFDANSGGNVQIGRDTFGGAFENWTRGYISNMRVIKGTQPYNAASTTITQPTASLSSVTNTVLLTCQSNRFVDANTQVTAKAVTTTGTPSVQPFSPFLPTAAYSASVNGGSGYFDGSGDYLTVPDDAAFDLPADFTFEFWTYNPNSSDKSYFQLGDYQAAQNGLLCYTSSNNLALYTNGGQILDIGSALPVNAWTHIAIVRSGGGSNNLKIYVNGVQGGQVTNTTSFTGVAGNGLAIGAQYGGSYVGITTATYISNFRLVKGTAVYTSAFTPPTSPLTAITNTSLLCNFTNAGIFDNTGKNNLETVGDAQIDTTTKKYGTGSMEFDGTGDYLKIPHSPNLLFGTGNFTIEFWWYPTNLEYASIIDKGFTSSGAILLQMNSSGTFEPFLNGTRVFFSSTALTVNNWYHIALVRSGSTVTLYLNGVSDGSGTSSADLNNTSGMGICGNFSGGDDGAGFIDDLRITKGVARYTTTFTPPTAAFPNL